MQADIDSFLPYMRDVVRCEQSLHELNLMWRMIESSAKMNCPQEARHILPTMAATRAHFNRLEQELVSSLVREKVSTVLDEIGTKAQQMIDIVVRNLYERTADVGFLATDKDLCRFVAGLSDDADAARERLRAYRSKYTVYDEILLLDLQGRVLAQIDDASPVQESRDPLIEKTLASSDYVESFCATDLRPSKARALIYSRRMHHPDTGSVVGLLCLCFHFEEEMAGIFRTHRAPGASYNMLLLDEHNQVIVSADPGWMALGRVVPQAATDDPGQLLMHGGRLYLARACRAAGYQGYMGPPGWQGQVMVPIDVAFKGRGGAGERGLNEGVAAGLLSHAQNFCPPLYEIMMTAETIRRVVWNGQVMTAGQTGELEKLKAVLEQISETGARSNALFAQSITDLYRTVLASGLADTEFVSRLLVDLLDRNLYERSDDCRWWALTPELRQVLAQPERSEEDVTGLRQILTYINSLYTVYTHIFVYDREGRILASSCREPGGAGLEGHGVDEATLARVRSLRSEQDYCVTPFVASPLYDNAATWVYHAAVRAPGAGQRVVGGIGIVFDATPELHAMLAGALAHMHQAKAFFIDREGRILSSTDPARAPGSMLEIDPALLKLARGSSASQLVVHEGQYAIMGCTASFGYREFKVKDGYSEDIIAVVYSCFGSARGEMTGPASGPREGQAIEAAPVGSACRDYATFWAGGELFALDAADVLEARAASEVQPVSMGAREESVGMLRLHGNGGAEEFIWVFDLAYLVNGVPCARDAGSKGQVIVARIGQSRVGLLVSDLHAVTAIAQEVVSPTPLSGGSLLVHSVIRANRGELLVQLLDLAVLHDMLRPPRQELPMAA